MTRIVFVVGLFLSIASTTLACPFFLQRCMPDALGAGCCDPANFRCLSYRCVRAIHSEAGSPCFIGAYGSCRTGRNLVCAGDHYCRNILVGTK